MSDTEYSIVKPSKKENEITKKITRQERKINPTKPITSKLPPIKKEEPSIKENRLILSEKEQLFIEQNAIKWGMTYDKALVKTIHDSLAVLIKLSNLKPEGY